LVKTSAAARADFRNRRRPCRRRSPQGGRRGPNGGQNTARHPRGGCWRGRGRTLLAKKCAFSGQNRPVTPPPAPLKRPMGAQTWRNGRPGVADHIWGGAGRGGPPCVTIIDGARGERKCLKHRSVNKVKRRGFRVGFRGGARPRGRRPPVWRARGPWGVVGS